MIWINIKDILPRHLQQCVFLLNNGNICVGKCRYFEYGDSELIDVHGEGISYLHTTYRNWELHNFDKTEYYTVTHFVPVPDVPDVTVFINQIWERRKMRTHKKELEAIANDLLVQSADAKGDENKPNYSNRDFMNATIIFQTALMDKMYDNQEYDGMSIENRLKMAESCGLSLRKLIHTFTGLDTHKIEEFL